MDIDKLIPRLSPLEIAACIQAFRDAAVWTAGAEPGHHITRLEMDIESLRQQLTEARSSIAGLEQFKAWADPQIVTQGEDQKRIAELEADAARLDYLERELDVEAQNQSKPARNQIRRSLFRRNVPITRAAIDAAIAAREVEKI